jgi:predicted nuclease with TOPRIM domain
MSDQYNNININDLTSPHPLELKKNQLETRNKELKDENKRLNEKFEQLKKNVMDLKEQIDNIIYTQLDLQSKKIQDLKLQIKHMN